MNIILFGPPGAGKGTQARLISEHFDLALIASGDILRGEIKRKTPLGIQIEETLALGLFPSDDIILKIFKEYLDEVKHKGVILDGLPRTLNQAQKIDETFEQLGLKIDGVIQLVVDDEELVKRLSNRIICKTCGASYTPDIPPKEKGVCDICSGHDFIRRPDDEPSAIKTRLQLYNEKTKPLIDYYQKTHRLSVVDGMKSVKEVNAQIESLLG
ncbi:MAG TPA: adenylate kinase, partial [Alphaproteobacteria bacterium]|nr:adenylate kinase [Alphaproteobacteria bacterium]